MGGAVTFDFHDTLARCDDWFELEVRRLASAFLRWWGEQADKPADARLLDEADAAYRRLRERVVVDGRELTAEACVARVAEELGVGVDGPTIERGVETLMRATLAEATPIPGAVATVRALEAKGVPLGIVSSAVYHPYLEWTLAAFRLRDAFADVTTSASAGYYKSRPELFWHATGALGAEPGRSVHVGDSYRFDVAGARRAGMATVWLRPDPERTPDGDPPDVTVASLEDAAAPILALLRSRAA